jgi:hypothetical protein
MKRSSSAAQDESAEDRDLVTVDHGMLPSEFQAGRGLGGEPDLTGIPTRTVPS